MYAYAQGGAAAQPPPTGHYIPPPPSTYMPNNQIASPSPLGLPGSLATGTLGQHHLGHSSQINELHHNVFEPHLTDLSTTQSKRRRYKHLIFLLLKNCSLVAQVNRNIDKSVRHTDNNIIYI